MEYLFQVFMIHYFRMKRLTVEGGSQRAAGTRFRLVAEKFITVLIFKGAVPFPEKLSGSFIFPYNLHVFVLNSDNVTHLLVTDFVGNNGDDLDTDDDGVLDITPWNTIVDCVALTGRSRECRTRGG